MSKDFWTSLLETKEAYTKKLYDELTNKNIEYKPHPTIEIKPTQPLTLETFKNLDLNYNPSYLTSDDLKPIPLVSSKANLPNIIEQPSYKLKDIIKNLFDFSITKLEKDTNLKIEKLKREREKAKLFGLSIHQPRKITPTEQALIGFTSGFMKFFTFSEKYKETLDKSVEKIWQEVYQPDYKHTSTYHIASAVGDMMAFLTVLRLTRNFKLATQTKLLSLLNKVGAASKLGTKLPAITSIIAEGIQFATIGAAKEAINQIIDAIDKKKFTIHHIAKIAKKFGIDTLLGAGFGLADEFVPIIKSTTKIPIVGNLISNIPKDIAQASVASLISYLDTRNPNDVIGSFIGTLLFNQTLRATSSIIGLSKELQKFKEPTQQKEYIKNEFIPKLTQKPNEIIQNPITKIEDKTAVEFIQEIAKKSNIKSQDPEKIIPQLKKMSTDQLSDLILKVSKNYYENYKKYTGENTQLLRSFIELFLKSNGLETKKDIIKKITHTLGGISGSLLKMSDRELDEFINKSGLSKEIIDKIKSLPKDEKLSALFITYTPYQLKKLITKYPTLFKVKETTAIPPATRGLERKETKISTKKLNFFYEKEPFDISKINILKSGRNGVILDRNNNVIAFIREPGDIQFKGEYLGELPKNFPKASDTRFLAFADLENVDIKNIPSNGHNLIGKHISKAVKKGEAREVISTNLKFFPSVAIYKDQFDRYFVYDASAVKLIKDKYPDAKTYISKDGSLVFQKNNEIIGAIAKYDIENYADVILNTRRVVEKKQIEGNYDIIKNEAMVLFNNDEIRTAQYLQEMIDSVISYPLQEWLIQSEKLFAPEQLKQISFILPNGYRVSGTELLNIIKQVNKDRVVNTVIKEIGFEDLSEGMKIIKTKEKIKKTTQPNNNLTEAIENTAQEISKEEIKKIPLKEKLTQKIFNLDDIKALSTSAIRDKENPIQIALIKGEKYLLLPVSEKFSKTYEPYFVFKINENGEFQKVSMDILKTATKLITISESHLSKILEYQNTIPTLFNPLLTHKSDELSLSSPFANVLELKDYLEKSFRLTIKRGGLRGKVLGKTKGGIIRVKSLSDLPTLYHEISHNLLENYQTLQEFTNKNSEIFKNYFFMIAQKAGISSKKLQKLKVDPSKEGFSWFVSDLLIGNHENLSSLPSSLINDFLGWLNRNNEIKEVLTQIQTYNNFLLSSSATDKIKQQIALTPENQKGFLKKFSNSNEMIYEIFDDLIGLKRFSKTAKKLGIKFDFTQDPYYLARLTSWGEVDYVFHRGIEDISTGKKMSEPLIKIINDIRNLKPLSKARISEKEAYTDFCVYLLAKRTERAKQLRQPVNEILEANSSKAIKELTSKYGKAIDDLAERLNNFNRALFDFLYINKLIDEEFYKSAIERWNFYVPFYRVLDDGIINSPVAPKQIRTFLKNIQHELKGSDLMLQDPIQSSIKNLITFMNLFHNTRKARAIMSILEQDIKGDLLKFVELLPSPAGLQLERKGIPKEINKKLVELFGNEKGKLSDEIKQHLKDIYYHIYMPLNVDVNRMIITARDPSGKLKSLKFNDPVLFRGLVLLSGKETPLLENFINFIGIPSRLTRAGAVEFSPFFLIKNILRDSFTYSLYTNKKFSIPVINILFNLPKALYHILGKTELYYQARRYELEKATLVGLDLYTKPIIKGKVRKFLVNYNPIYQIMKLIQTMSEYSDLIPRLAEMEYVKKNLGKSWMEAAFAGREVTQDFSRMGHSVRFLNRITAFLGANVGGWYRMAEELRNHPFRFMLRALLNIVIPSISLYFFNRNDKTYKDLPNYIKNLNWLVFIGKDKDGKSKFLKIPKPFDLGVLLGSLPEKTLEIIEYKDPSAVQLGSCLWQGIGLNIVPQIGRLGMTLALNYDLFKGRPTIPNYLTDVLETEQSRLPSGNLSKIIAKMFRISSYTVTAAVNELGLSNFELLFDTLDFVKAYLSKDKTTNNLLLGQDVKSRVMRVLFVKDRPSEFTQPMINFYKDFYYYRKIYNTLRLYNDRLNQVRAGDDKNLIRVEEKNFDSFKQKLSKEFNSLEDFMKIWYIYNDIYNQMRKYHTLLQSMIEAKIPISEAEFNEYIGKINKISENMNILSKKADNEKRKILGKNLLYSEIER
ncbi:MAG: LPD38 domain-containing protein [Candidatus Aenigmatarchaeota archaeon]